jgi:hypothetical protein
MWTQVAKLKNLKQLYINDSIPVPLLQFFPVNYVVYLHSRNPLLLVLYNMLLDFIFNVIDGAQESRVCGTSQQTTYGRGMWYKC